MEFFENLIILLDGMLDADRKRHVAGGFLLSMSLFFSGLAVTVMTIKNDIIEEDKDE